MRDHRLPQMRLFFTGIVAVFELAHLFWEHYHGGVQSHHILNRQDLPAISNWWGALLLPSLAWLLSGRILKRAVNSISGLPAGILFAFLGSFLYSVSFSVAFEHSYTEVLGYMFFGMFAMALILPIYRGEFILGLILGMTVTFGAVIPAAISAMLAAVSALFHGTVRRIFMWIVARL